MKHPKFPKTLYVMNHPDAGIMAFETPFEASTEDGDWSDIASYTLADVTPGRRVLELKKVTK
jgi:hypothetical protein